MADTGIVKKESFDKDAVDGDDEEDDFGSDGDDDEGKTDTDGKPKSGKSGKSRRELPPGAVAILKAWLLSAEHFTHPYPTAQDQISLMNATGIDKKQLKNWFTNARRRIWKPMMKKQLEASHKSQLAAGHHFHPFHPGMPHPMNMGMSPFDPSAMVGIHPHAQVHAGHGMPPGFLPHQMHHAHPQAGFMHPQAQHMMQTGQPMMHGINISMQAQQRPTRHFMAVQQQQQQHNTMNQQTQNPQQQQSGNNSVNSNNISNNVSNNASSMAHCSLSMEDFLKVFNNDGSQTTLSANQSTQQQAQNGSSNRSLLSNMPASFQSHPLMKTFSQKSFSNLKNIDSLSKFPRSDSYAFLEVFFNDEGDQFHDGNDNIGLSMDDVNDPNLNPAFNLSTVPKNSAHAVKSEPNTGGSTGSGSGGDLPSIIKITNRGDAAASGLKRSADSVKLEAGSDAPAVKRVSIGVVDSNVTVANSTTSPSNKSSEAPVHVSTAARCPFCPELNVDTMLRPCGHLFHGNCLKTWLQDSHGIPGCPVCHVPIASCVLAIPCIQNNSHGAGLGGSPNPIGLSSIGNAGSTVGTVGGSAIDANMVPQPIKQE